MNAHPSSGAARQIRSLHRLILRRGLTVLELLIALVVIGVLTTTALVLFQGPQRRSQEAALRNDLKNYATAQELRRETQGLYATAPRWLSEFQLSRGVQVLGSGGDHRSHWLLALGHEKGRAVCALAGGLGANPNLARTPVCGEGGTLTFSVSNDNPEVYETVTFDATTSLGDLGLAPADVELLLWDFGDGSTAVGPASTHLKRTQSFVAPGREFETSLIVVARSGGVHSGSKPLRTRGAPTPTDGNLVLNGNGASLSNSNFSRFSFVPEPVGAARGFFRVVVGTGVSRPIDQAPTPFDSTRTYHYSFDVRATQESPSTFRMAYHAFDEDGLLIDRGMYIRVADARLARDLMPGDTVVYLTSAAGWLGDSTREWERTFAIWNYRSARGTEFGEYTYTRRFLRGAWLPGGIDAPRGIVRLSVPLPTSMGNPDHPQGTWPAGTAVSNTNRHDGIEYCDARHVAAPAAWTHFECTFGGMNHTGRNVNGRMPTGTASFRPLLMAGYSNPVQPVTVDYANIRLEVLD
jgi:prepilin-type N-terminal cleavage/methylation domain-containing protein